MECIQYNNNNIFINIYKVLYNRVAIDLYYRLLHYAINYSNLEYCKILFLYKKTYSNIHLEKISKDTWLIDQNIQWNTLKRGLYLLKNAGYQFIEYLDIAYINNMTRKTKIWSHPSIDKINILNLFLPNMDFKTNLTKSIITGNLSKVKKQIYNGYRCIHDDMLLASKLGYSNIVEYLSDTYSECEIVYDDMLAYIELEHYNCKNNIEFRLLYKYSKLDKDYDYIFLLRSILDDGDDNYLCKILFDNYYNLEDIIQSSYMDNIDDGRILTWSNKGDSFLYMKDTFNKLKKLGYKVKYPDDIIYLENMKYKKDLWNHPSIDIEKIVKLLDPNTTYKTKKHI